MRHATQTTKDTKMTLAQIVNQNLVEREHSVTLSVSGIQLVAAHLGISTVSDLKGTHLADIALACSHEKRFAAPKTAACKEAGLDGC